MNRTLLLSAMFSLMVLSLGCDKGDDDDGNNDPSDPMTKIVLNISGLQDLGSSYAYEGWIMVNGEPVSTGSFKVNSSGQLNQNEFNVNTAQLNAATAFVLTIESTPDQSSAPSGTKILAGDFSGNTANLSVAHGSALGNDFSGAAGSYILATPTNGMNTNENSGVWFLNPSAGPGPSLTIPTLPSGWKYEGWAVINGTPVTTGKFTMASGADERAPYSGSMPGPAFPGEDFLMNAPSGLTFPTDLSGQKVVITIEPEPDNSTMPFNLKPLSGDVPASAMSGTSYNLTTSNVNAYPSGTVSR